MVNDVAIRVQATTLRILAKGYHEIEEQTGINERTLRRIINRAKERGLDPTIRPARWKNEWFIDAPRCGRPSKKEGVLSELTRQVTLDRYAREKSCQELASDLTKAGLPCSPMTVWRTLRNAGFRKTKPTRKPGLSAKAKVERLAWCREHENWTLDDWKRVIWSDETSVLLGHRRGGYRVWRRPDEGFAKSVVRERWAGYQEVRGAHSGSIRSIKLTSFSTYFLR